MAPHLDKTERNQVQREIILHMKDLDEPVDGDDLARRLEDISEEEFRWAISDLLDKHRISLTPEWDYQMKS